VGQLKRLLVARHHADAGQQILTNFGVMDKLPDRQQGSWTSGCIMHDRSFQVLETGIRNHLGEPQSHSFFFFLFHVEPSAN
jgi:hypothetical protein